LTGFLHRIRARIDRGALRHNLQVARRHANGAGVVAVVKANAYGHGLIPTAEALEAADIFGVTDVEEAERLHAAGSPKPILILQGLITAADLAPIIARGYQCVIHRHSDLALLEAACARTPPRQPLTLWLKLDTGMGRLGLQDIAQDAVTLRRQPWVKDVVLMTHLASGSDPAAPLNARQMQKFDAICAALPDFPTSYAASAGLLTVARAAHWCRPGIMLYGSSPFAWQDQARRREALDLRTVMTLEARLLSIKTHQAGDSIGYNSQFVCDRVTRVGIVACGYADGYPSNTPNGCPVEVAGVRSRTLGRVSMDMLAIDLSEAPAATLDSPVTLWGAAVSLDEVAAHTGILSYNLTCSVSPRVPRLYV